jgi:hypothetical protein
MGMQKRDVGLIVMAILSAALIVPAFSSAQKKTDEKGSKDIRETCHNRHAQIKSLKEGLKHAGLSCATCHASTADHLKSVRNRQVTTIELQQMTVSCGQGFG